MKQLRTFAGTLFALMLTTACMAQPKANYQVVPLPQTISFNDKANPFLLGAETKIVYHQSDGEEMRRNASFLSEYIQKNTGLKLRVVTEAGKKEKNINLILNNKLTEPEGYRMTISDKGIHIEAATPNGVFYGIQTLRKSLPVGVESQVELPAAQISDAPRFGYRGMHLDCSRHFFPVEFVKQYIDMLALHNMNKFHWHLTDDQGWRIEIKRYPELAKIGSVRKTTTVGHNTHVFDGVPHTGYYTVEDAKEIVAYAKERYITVIPEIDMPGHMLGALKVFPELGCTGGPYEVSPLWGVFTDVLCIGNEKTFDFVEGVLDEIMEIFPSKYIHIGGDEAPRASWKECPKCQQRIKDQHIVADDKHTAEDKLQSYFMSRVEKYLNSKGHQIIGWDEILDGEVAPNATVMSWRGTKGGIAAAKMGHDVIMTPTTYLYFDYYQSPKTVNEPIAASYAGALTIDKTYSFEPLEGLNADEAKHILGVQANLWTEYIPYPNQAEYMVLPRMGALCEIQWMQPEKKNYDDFLKRVPRLVDIYKAYDWTYATHILPADYQIKFKF